MRVQNEKNFSRICGLFERPFLGLGSEMEFVAFGLAEEEKGLAIFFAPRPEYFRLLFLL